MSISNQTDFYLNFQQFGELKLAARDGSDEAKRSVAQQFEGLFVQQMLAAMRSASNIDSAQNSSYMDFYQEMYDKQLAQTIARQDRLGVAKMIMQQMPAETVAAESDTAAINHDLGPITVAMTQLETAKSSPAPVVETREIASVVASKVVDDDFAESLQIDRANQRWLNPQHFVADILPAAQSAAETLGVSAKLLVAQSALETGWGKYTMKFSDGRSSNNLFGIKAGSEWQGNLLNKTSLEYHDGVLHNQVSSFRAYASPAQSLADYVNFIQGNPRYHQALKQAGDDQAYIREIQSAGYATDPAYADKVISILNSETLRQSIGILNNGDIDHA